MGSKKLKQLGHLLAGVLILIHGFSAIEEGNFKSSAGYFGIAIITLLVAGLYKSINRQFHQADVAFFLLEAVTLFYSGWDYNEKGHKALFYFMAIIAALYFLFAFACMIFYDTHHKKHASDKSHRRVRRTGSKLEA